MSDLAKATHELGRAHFSARHVTSSEHGLRRAATLVQAAYLGHRGRAVARRERSRRDFYARRIQLGVRLMLAAQAVAHIREARAYEALVVRVQTLFRGRKQRRLRAPRLAFGAHERMLLELPLCAA